jgi:hypothetical protein
MALVARCDDPEHPLDGLATTLAAALGDQRVSTQTAGDGVTALRAVVADRVFDAQLMGGTVQASDVQEVRGVVIRRQELDLGGLLAELALLLAPLAATDPRLHATLTALPA